jgi:hypothetical protein
MRVALLACVVHSLNLRDLGFDTGHPITNAYDLSGEDLPWWSG